MNNEYYTPILEEFHIGFEYEYTYKNQDWKYAKFSNSGMDEIAGDYYEFDPENPNTKCRVKRLSAEDIESLGFNNYKPPHEYDHTWQLGMYELKAWFNHKLPHVRISFSSQMIFDGDIKNKSELKKLMKQLEIL